MAPYQLRDETLKRLRRVRAAMMSLDYLLRLESLPPERQKQAALQLSRTQAAYLKLRAAQLAEIRDALLDNEPALVAGMQALDRTLRRLNRIETFLVAATDFLRIVGRIV